MEFTESYQQSPLLVYASTSNTIPVCVWMGQRRSQVEPALSLGNSWLGGCIDFSFSFPICLQFALREATAEEHLHRIQALLEKKIFRSQWLVSQLLDTNQGTERPACSEYERKPDAFLSRQI